MPGSPPRWPCSSGNTSVASQVTSVSAHPSRSARVSAVAHIISIRATVGNKMRRVSTSYFPNPRSAPARSGRPHPSRLPHRGGKPCCCRAALRRHYAAARRPPRLDAALHRTRRRQEAYHSRDGHRRRRIHATPGRRPLSHPHRLHCLLPPLRWSPTSIAGFGSSACAELLNRFRDRGHNYRPVPSAVCRNSRMVGYQGLSLRSSPHRHSGEAASTIHIGRPRAPARCATEVSELMTRSRPAITAAVSRKASGPRSRSALKSTIRSANGTLRNCSSPGPF